MPGGTAAAQFDATLSRYSADETPGKGYVSLGGPDLPED
jgi:hypothetical protein